MESLREPRVRIGVGAFGKSKWAQVAGALAESAWYAATLLSGEMPDDIKEVFAGLGFSLFPATSRELSLHCCCPGEYASESEVIREGLRTLFARDHAIEAWLRDEVATAYDAVVSDPSRAVTAQTVRARLAAEQAGSL